MQREKEVFRIVLTNGIPNMNPVFREKIISPKEAPISAAELERRISFLYDRVSKLFTHVADLQIRTMANQESAFARGREINERIDMLKREVDFLLIHKQAEDCKKHQVSN
ncbi:hypothetical protein [Xylella fastidiosa]|uniref:hypothetical protein n=1 Tax=Xylella fastidiosa TaxID=2371 RepID=UPI00049B2EA3|nr:hypothetical protein [Xylella fastidiosa]AIC13755.1 hypothetical protein P303_05215 [Xylella fastidiosa MUL0034]MDD0930336.1 hypothetical protein [Xylella fastidiosa subsp. multiplex]MDD0943621.1 hypothetical protein [Xylella fastidiosa subsp. multiplex]QTX30828.1 hypothetical protein KBP48_05035 [Xylella fastidiosa subsp. multiplex]RWA36820.1 hypothetical protein XfCFBP8078_11090 [Xylella fastidiosa subsp. multiplex]